MYRDERLVVRMNRAEKDVVERLARVEHLPASTLARRLLLNEAERHGLILASDQRPQGVADSGECSP